MKKWEKIIFYANANLSLFHLSYITDSIFLSVIQNGMCIVSAVIYRAQPFS